MNFEELLIEKQEVTISINEYNRRQVRLVAALLDISEFLYQKEAALVGELAQHQNEIAFKEAA